MGDIPVCKAAGASRQDSASFRVLRQPKRTSVATVRSATAATSAGSSRSVTASGKLRTLCGCCTTLSSALSRTTYNIAEQVTLSMDSNDQDETPDNCGIASLVAASKHPILLSMTENKYVYMKCWKGFHLPRSCQCSILT